MKKLLALAAAGALVTAPTAATAAGAANTLSIAQQDEATRGGEGLFGSPEATVGVIIFSVVTIFGLMVAFGVFDEDDRAISA